RGSRRALSPSSIARAARPPSRPRGARAMTAAVTLDGVSCVFGSGAGAVRAVDGVDLTIEAGEFFTLLGPSASGKTTCLRMIGGFTLPSAGRVRIGGVDVTMQPPYA